MSLHSLPIFVRLRGRAVVLVGTGEAATAKRRVLERAGAVVVREDGAPYGSSSCASIETLLPIDIETGALDVAPSPRLAIVVDDEPAVARLKARGILVNAVDRPDLCDFTLPAIVDRDPVIVAIGTGGASAGLAAALRQRLEALLPAGLGRLADGLFAARSLWRTRYPDSTERRRAIAEALAFGGQYDPFHPTSLLGTPPDRDDRARTEIVTITLASSDPDDLTLRQARLLANADRVTHGPGVPASILDRARADADRLACAAPSIDLPGLTVDVRMA